MVVALAGCVLDDRRDPVFGRGVELGDEPSRSESPDQLMNLERHLGVLRERQDERRGAGR
jgi:hypothetical protein